MWQGVSESLPFHDGRTMIMAGHSRQKFVCYPISDVAGEPECVLLPHVHSPAHGGSAFVGFERTSGHCDR